MSRPESAPARPQPVPTINVSRAWQSTDSEHDAATHPEPSAESLASELGHSGGRATGSGSSTDPRHRRGRAALYARGGRLQAL